MDIDGGTIAAVVGIIAIVLPILIVHERRLTRIEAKIDTIMRLLRGDYNER